MRKWRASVAAAAVAGLLMVAIAMPAAAANPHARNAYRQNNLVSDIPGLAHRTDPNLVNPWGMSFSPTSPLWVSDEGTGVSTLYSGATRRGDPTAIVPLVVTIPGAAPTGQVFNGSNRFVVKSGSASGPALFIFASLTGKITGWNPAVPPPPPSTNAQVAISRPHAVYTGLAIANTAKGNWIYAANFSGRRIDVFNGKWNAVHMGFHDPSLPAGYSPFNIQKLGGKLYVAYAKVNPSNGESLAGAHLGFVDKYSLHGRLLGRVASRGALNAPWGLAWAPAHGFGRFSGDLLVGNFGNGHISAFNPANGHFDGQLRRPSGKVIKIPGLWALMFGNGTAGSRHSLLFTAGIREERHGLLGKFEFAH
jgi:uncharacterized protein (TIGR03118 family)